MRHGCIVVIAVVTALTLAGVGSAWADTVTAPGTTTMMFLLGSGVISIVNVLCMTVGDGSKAVGIAGIAIGGGLIISALADDTLDEEGHGGYVAIGVATAALGLLDALVPGRRDTELLGMRVDPSARSFDGQGYFGLQLSSRW